MALAVAESRSCLLSSVRASCCLLCSKVLPEESDSTAVVTFDEELDSCTNRQSTWPPAAGQSGRLSAESDSGPHVFYWASPIPRADRGRVGVRCAGVDMSSGSAWRSLAAGHWEVRPFADPLLDGRPMSASDAHVSIAEGPPVAEQPRRLEVYRFVRHSLQY